jgi:hypothetical protein
MGSKNSGNRVSRRPKLPPELKSRLYQVRLDPKKPEHRPLMDGLDNYLSNDGYERGEQMRELLELGLVAKGAGEFQQRQVRVSTDDVLDIKEVVYYIMDKLESGLIVQGSGGRVKKAKKIDLPDPIRNTLDHYIGGGISAEDDE